MKEQTANSELAIGAPGLDPYSVPEVSVDTVKCFEVLVERIVISSVPQRWPRFGFGKSPGRF